MKLEVTAFLIAIVQCIPLATQSILKRNLMQPPPSPFIASIALDNPQISGPVMSLDEACDMAMKDVQTMLGMGKDEMEMTANHTSPSGMHHIYAVQMFNGIPIVNAMFSMSVMDSSVVSWSHSAAPQAAVLQARSLFRRDVLPTDPTMAILAFAISMNFPSMGYVINVKANPGSDPANPSYTCTGAVFSRSPILATLKYYNTGSSLLQVWELSIDVSTNYYVAHVTTASPPEIVSMSDMVWNFAKRQAAVTPFSYRAVPIGNSDPAVAKGTQLFTAPWNLKASPLGWQDIGDGNGAIDLMAGNNVAAGSNPDNLDNLDAIVTIPATNNAFDFPLNDALPAENANNMKAAVANMFYVANYMHDVFYNYGFTEAAGNFQVNNFNNGGTGDDPVIALAQDGSGTNNANFATLPDGSPGVMRMFIFDVATPTRDGALDNGIIMHELTHGLSSRLVGGKANTMCLNSLISGGMGEGWSDAVALVMNLPAGSTNATNLAVGAYALGDKAGVRKFMYSKSLTVNPQLFSRLNAADTKAVHRIGEVWCTMLYEVLWNMIDQTGMRVANNLLVSSANSGAGNSDFLKLLIEGMKMTPCNPTFVQARNAIVMADKAITNGKHACSIWNGFAKRGLGLNAVDKAPFVDNFDLPAGCTKNF